MRKPVMMAVLLGSPVAACLAAESSPWESKVVGPEGQIQDYPIQFGRMTPEALAPGQKCWVGIAVTNRGKIPIRIPIICAPSSVGSVLSVKARKLEGGEEVSYPSGALGRQGIFQVVTILPGRTEWLQTWFVPWSPGMYEWTLVLENRTTRWTEWHTESLARGPGRWTDVTIPNVWVGKVVLSGTAKTVCSEPSDREDVLASGRLRAHGLLTREVSFEFVDKPLEQALREFGKLAKVKVVLAPEASEKRNEPINLKASKMSTKEALAWILRLADLDYEGRSTTVVVNKRENLKGDGSIVDIQSELETLEGVVLDDRRPLGPRLGALSSLVEMRHVFATDALVRIENETRDDRLIHTHVVRALHDMAFKGTGYRELVLFGYIAADKRTTTQERILCLDVLSTYAKYGEFPPRPSTWCFGQSIVHVVTEKEKEGAARILKRLERDLELGRGGIEKLLKSGVVPVGEAETGAGCSPEPKGAAAATTAEEAVLEVPRAEEAPQSVVSSGPAGRFGTWELLAGLAAGVVVGGLAVALIRRRWAAREA